MFLNIWNSFISDTEDYNKYNLSNAEVVHKGILIPYGENPLDVNMTAKEVYMNIINRADKYLYIATPYLVIDTDIVNALQLASFRGVDVRIIIPGIPDKKLVYELTKSYVESLIGANIKVYKYTPGFIHSKIFVSDDKVSTVGTINLDYRSLYLHFECNAYLENVECIEDIKKDMEKTMEESHKISYEEAKIKFFKGIWYSVLRIFAPLM